MKIALAGAGGVGKGTLGIRLAEYLGVPFLPSHIKETGISMGLINGYRDTNNPSQDLAFQWTIMNGQIAQERALIIAGLGYVAERSTFDYIPYFKQRCLVDPNYLKTARDWAADIYDGIIFIPVEFDSPDKVENAWKERDRVNQDRTSSIIAEEISNHYPGRLLVVHGTVKERFQQILTWIEKMENLKRKKVI